jgi:hypothetical protein
MGPNTGLGHNSMIFMIEAQVRYSIELIGRILSKQRATIDVSYDAQRNYNRRIQSALSKTVWASGCRSWYQTKGGRHAVLWPGFTFSYWLRTRRPNMQHYKVR